MYLVSVYGKLTGRANNENKYDFTPPIDTVLFFGSCAIVAQDENNKYTNLNVELWNTLYEKLFGGFEDLSATALEDEMEEDELANVPKEKKTKEGYLKDGFVVSDNEDGDCEGDCDNDDETSSTNEENTKGDDEYDEDVVIEDIGSELSEESYDYDSDDKSDK
jgi:hypothetical protein